MPLQARLPPQCQSTTMPKLTSSVPGIPCVRSQHPLTAPGQVRKQLSKHSPCVSSWQTWTYFLVKRIHHHLCGDIIPLYIEPLAPLLSRHLNYSDCDTDKNFRIITSSRVNNYSNEIPLFPAVAFCSKIYQNCPCALASPPLQHNGCLS